MAELAPSRRTLVRGAAWSVPVVAMAATAPAFAASCGSITTSYALDWNNTARTTYTPPATPAGTGTGKKTGYATALATAGSGASSVTVTFDSTTVGTVSRTANNLVLGGSNVGGTGGPGLQLTHDSLQTGRGNRQELVITFSRPVTELSFSIADIDSSSGSWYDQVELTGTTGSGVAAFTQSPVATTSSTSVVVWGDGSQGQPWRPRNDSQNIGSGSSAGNKTLTFTTAVKTLTLVYWNSAGNGNQIIALTDFSFKAKGC